MAGAQTTINNQLNLAAAMTTDTATMAAATIRMKTKAPTRASVAWQRQRGNGGGSMAS